MIYDWWWLMNIDDVCRLYSLWFYRVPWFPLLFSHPNPRSLYRNESFLTSLSRSTSALLHASGRCAPASPVLPILLGQDDHTAGRWQMSEDGLLRRGSWPRSWRNVPKLQRDLLLTAKRVVILKTSRLEQLCCKHAMLQDVRHTCIMLSLNLEIDWCRMVGVKALSGSERDACLSTES